MTCSWRWFIHPETAISINRNGSIPLCVFKTHYRPRSRSTEPPHLHADPVFGPYANCPDLHDDIGSSLSQIAILSEIAHRRVNGQSPDLEAPLHDNGSISREVVESMSDRFGRLIRRRTSFASFVIVCAGLQWTSWPPPTFSS